MKKSSELPGMLADSSYFRPTLTTMNILDFFFYSSAIIIIAVRLYESRQSARNKLILSNQGFSLRQYDSSRTLSQFFFPVWIISCMTESLLYPSGISPELRIAALAILILCQLLKFWSVRSLGTHWCLEIFAPDKADTPSLGILTSEAMQSGINERVEIGLKSDLFVETGPYKYVRHPYYLAVIVEIAALAVLGNALLSAIAMSFLFNHLIKRLIDHEEGWLFSRPGYHELFYHKSRFIPF